MKGIRQLITIMIIAVATSCSSTQSTTSQPDDVYYSKGDAPQSPSPAVGHRAPSNPNSGSSYDSQGNQSQDNSTDYYRGPDSSNTAPQNQSNDYYNGDHYDYDYSARIRRYYAPAYGYGYYDPYYTNSYWYDYNPYSYGTSIYLGYSFWGPTVSFGIGFGWGSPYYGGYGYYGYPSYGYPYYPYYGYGYPSYGYPYYGYGSPYCGYHNPYYYNSYDGNTTTYHYGPRGSISGTGGRTADGRTGANTPTTLGERYEQAMADGRLSSVNGGSTRNGGTTTPVRKGMESNSVSAQVQQGRTDNVNSGGTRGSVKTITPETNSGLTGEIPVKTSRGIISDKNESGGTRVNNGTIHDGSTPPRGNQLQQAFTNPQTERTNAQALPKSSAESGGDVRPSNNSSISGSQHLPSRGSGQPKDNSVQGLQQNNGGTVRPNSSQPGGSNQWNQRNNGLNNSGNMNPGSNDRARMYQQQPQPKFNSPQSSPQPHQQPSYSQPSRGNSAPGGGSNPGGGGGRSNGGGSGSGSGRSGGGRK